MFEIDELCSVLKMNQIYPEALFPDVYFVIGIANTGGTASANGLLIGTELYGLTDKTPRGEFVELFRNFMPTVKDEAEIRSLAARYTNVALKPVEGIPAIVAHESCHFNQKYPAQKIYGEKHEAQLWQEFQTEMYGKNEKTGCITR